MSSALLVSSFVETDLVILTNGTTVGENPNERAAGQHSVPCLEQKDLIVKREKTKWLCLLPRSHQMSSGAWTREEEESL